MVTTRRSIRTIRSTIGMRKINPGPLAPSNFPSRKITPRSYSRRIRIACGRMMMARIMMGTAQLSNRGNVSISSMVLFSFGFQFYYQPLHCCNLSLLVFFDRRIAHRIPIFAFDKDAAAARVDWRQCGHYFSNECFLSHLHRQQLGAQAFSNYENEERRGDQGGWNNVVERQTKQRIGAVEEHERTDEKCDDSPDR